MTTKKRKPTLFNSSSPPLETDPRRRTCAKCGALSYPGEVHECANRKPKTKAPKVEAWVLVAGDGTRIASSVTGPQDFGHVVPSERIAHMVEANPRADAVVSAARKLFREDCLQGELRLAVEALERGG